MKKFLSLLISACMIFSLCTPALAITTKGEGNIPPWVEEGEEWYPVGDIIPFEDFGDCAKGHVCPPGYTYQGYTIGVSSGHYDKLAGVLRIIAIFAPDKITVGAALLSAEYLSWLDEHEDPDIKYMKYVYKKGNSTFYHIMYVEEVTGTPKYKYLSCETYYG